MSEAQVKSWQAVLLFIDKEDENNILTLHLF